LNAYKIDIFCSGGKLKIRAKCGSKLMNSNAYYNSILVKMGMILVVLTSELESLSFLILMFLRVSQGEPKPQGAKHPPTYILDSFNKFLEVLILPNALPPCKKINHKIEVVSRVALPSRHPIG
jgi:hypothetical protein